MTKNSWPSEEATALYVHIPFCRGKCDYCGFYSRPIGDYDVGRYLSAVARELDSHHISNPVETVYLGGGSPSALPEDQLLFLVDLITSRVGKPAEFTVEANPGQISDSWLSSLRCAGVNRLSLGAQSFIEEELIFLTRPYQPVDIVNGVTQARRAGFDNVSLDLIFAIPGSTLDTWRYSLEKAMALSVEHISAYSLSFEPNTPLGRRLQAGRLEKVDEETDRKMYETAIDRLGRAGWEQYEISNFAREGFRCRHNLRYWANQSYVGLGPSASSWQNHCRTTNIRDIHKYIEALEQNQSPIAERDEPAPLTRAGETAVLMLRRIKGIDLMEFRRGTDFDALGLFAEPIRKYQALGLITVKSDHIRLTKEALPIADSILCDFVQVD